MTKTGPDRAGIRVGTERPSVGRSLVFAERLDVCRWWLCSVAGGTESACLSPCKWDANRFLLCKEPGLAGQLLSGIEVVLLPVLFPTGPLVPRLPLSLKAASNLATACDRDREASGP